MIYLCIPAHNEEQTVGVVLWKIRQVMADLQRDYQLLVADDGSTDRTFEVLEPYMRVLPLTVFRTKERRGYATSLEMLVREAVARSDYPKRDTIITLQADFTDEPGHVEALIKRVESGADIVASNALPLRNAPRLVRWQRPVLNALLRRLGWPDEVRDPLNGFNAFRVFCIRKAMEGRSERRLLRGEGWVANAQLLHQAAPHARRIDGVDLEPHPERRQRDSRFVFMPVFRQVLDLRRGREASGQRPVEALRPDSVAGGPSSRRGLVAESLRAAVDGARTHAPEPRRADNGRRRPGGGQEDRTSRPRGRRTAEAQGNAGRKPRREAAPGGESRRRRESPPRDGPRRRSATSTPADNEPRADIVELPAAQDTGAAAPAAGPARRRSRRGRRGSGRSSDAAGMELVAADADTIQTETGENPEPGEAVPAGPTVVPESSPGPHDGETARLDDAADPAVAGPRRRRSRRGGRGRKRRGGGETNGAPEGEQLPAPPDFDPPYEETEPKAS